MIQPPQAKYRQDYQAPDYTITDIDLTFDLAADNTIVTAVSQVKQLAKGVDSLLLSGEQLQLLQIEIDGKAWHDYQLLTDGLLLNQLPETFTLMIKNAINPTANSSLEGLYQSGDALCTQCEAEGFRHITYSLDRPDVLARFSCKIIADKQQYPYLLSNGNCIAHGELSEGRHWVQWQDPYPKPCYLFALVAGDFDRLQERFTTRSGREITLELFVDRGNLTRADWAMASLKRAMRWDEERFGLEYDLDIYMIVAVDFFNMGAMENKGLNLFNSKYVLANRDTATDNDYLAIESVIGHEYFHNWTGNRVTCRDWFQLSLKEGLTVFRDQEFSSDMGSRAVNRINAVKLLRSAQFPEDSGPMAHPIRPEKVIEMNNFYTLTVYEKGAEVIRMLHTLLGEQQFQAGMQRYLTLHDGCAATCDDFVQAMEEASKIDLTLFRRWYSQSGTPELTVRDHYDEATKTYHLTVSQHTPITADQKEKLPLYIPLDLELYDEKGNIIPLIMEGEQVSSILAIKEAQQTLIFEQVKQKPIPSLLREFSAPVRLDYPYEDNQLMKLMQYATNDFARWDAAQMLLAKYIKLNVINYPQQKVMLPKALFAAFQAILVDEGVDPALKALILTLPNEREIAELFEVIDPEAIHFVAQQIKRTFANVMAMDWLATYQRYHQNEFSLEHSAMGARALKNCCLSYLAYHDATLSSPLIEKQYTTANNMTDRLAALSIAVESDLPCKASLLHLFDEQWHHDGLTMDKWFSLQGRANDEDLIEHLNQLLHHRSFSLNNPNRVRALVTGFTVANPYRFHHKNGEGYQFLLTILTKLNELNPQVAARLIEPLLQWKRYDNERQQLMKAALEKLRSLDHLSSDLFEKINKALELS